MDLESRLMTNGCTTNQDWDGDKPSLRRRVMMEVIVMLLCHYLRLPLDSFDSEDSVFDAPKICAPDSGGRFIATSTKTPSQTSHLDFFHDLETTNAGNAALGGPLGHVRYPGYFTLVTGDEDTPIWVLEGSQKYVYLQGAALEKVAGVEHMRLMLIPKNSVMIMRGDVLHAGSGIKQTGGNQCLRFHMYIHRDGVVLGDAINCRKIQIPTHPDDRNMAASRDKHLRRI